MNEAVSDILDAVARGQYLLALAQANGLFWSARDVFVSNDVMDVVENSVIPGVVAAHFPKPQPAIDGGLRYMDADVVQYDGFTRLFRDVLVRAGCALVNSVSGNQS